jgi:hypothetical protein
MPASIPSFLRRREGATDCKELKTLSLSAKDMDDFQFVGLKKEKFSMELYFDKG